MEHKLVKMIQIHENDLYDLSNDLICPTFDVSLARPVDIRARPLPGVDAEAEPGRLRTKKSGGRGREGASGWGHEGHRGRPRRRYLGKSLPMSA